VSPETSLPLDPSAADLQSLELARRGSPEALGHVLEFCRRYLLQIANSELDSHLQAKLGASDVVQETFLEAQRIFDRFQGDSPDELRAWLRAILLNKLADQDRHYRGTAKRDLAKEIVLGTSSVGPVEPTVPTPTPSNVLMQQERAVALTAALDRLPTHYRQVIVWRQIEDLSFEEMASRLDRSIDAVRKLWWRAIQQLQEELGNSL
jgi:RNA polymerase sigma-70 factor, ECF subfamily